MMLYGVQENGDGDDRIAFVNTEILKLLNRVQKKKVSEYQAECDLEKAKGTTNRVMNGSIVTHAHDLDAWTAVAEKFKDPNAVALMKEKIQRLINLFSIATPLHNLLQVRKIQQTVSFC